MTSYHVKLCISETGTSSESSFVDIGGYGCWGWGVDFVGFSCTFVYLWKMYAISLAFDLH